MLGAVGSFRYAHSLHSILYFYWDFFKLRSFLGKALHINFLKRKCEECYAGDFVRRTCFEQREIIV